MPNKMHENSKKIQTKRTVIKILQKLIFIRRNSRRITNEKHRVL